MSSGGANPPAPPWDEQGRTQLSENPSGEAEREYFKSDEEKEVTESTIYPINRIFNNGKNTQSDHIG
jgi:hypothetical protein